MATVIAVLPEIPALVTQVIVGAVTVICPVGHAAVPEKVTPAAARLLKEKVDAEGEAVFTPAPGKVIIIFPPEGIELIVVNLTVWTAVIGTSTTSPL